MNKARLLIIGINVLTEMAVHVLCMGRPMYEARLGIDVLTEMAVLVLCMGRPMYEARLGINVLTEMAVLVLCMGRPMYEARLGIDVGWQYLYCAWLFLPPALANLRAALVALSTTNASPGGHMASGSGLPGCVVLVSNLNEKV